MLFIVSNLVSQNLNSDKWVSFLEISKAQKLDKHEAYFLVTKHTNFKFEKQLYTTDKVVRVLDQYTCILKSNYSNISRYKNITYTSANDLWKLALHKTINESINKVFNIKSSDPNLLYETLEKLNIPIINKYNSVVSISTNLKTIKDELLALDYVSYISDETLFATPESIVKDLNLSINSISRAIQLYPDLTGLNQVIGVKDNSPNPEDIDLINKIEESSIASIESDAHATDMATIISGNGNSGAQGLGVLPKATIFPLDYNSLFPDAIETLNAANVSVINNSYGTVIENYYGALAAAYDEFMHDSPTKLPIFSSGNFGFETSESGAYQGILNYANITGNFKMSKNSISVGAIDQNNEILPFSSKGPAYDGRLKPEIVAFSFEGTSNACALVSGTAAMIQQAYVNNVGDLPPASLLKAALLNGADDVGRKGIDFDSGYGNLNAVESLNIINSNQYKVATIINNDNQSFEITIPENAKNLKVMLVWTDIEAEPNDNIALKNNLDLNIDDGEDTFFPSILNSNPSIQNLQAEPTTGLDNLNPVEQVVIESPNSTNYTINVSASSLVTENQVFSLVYSWDLKDDFDWIFPLQNSNFPYYESTTGYVRWKANFEEPIEGTLQVNYNNTGIWETIANEINLEEGVYEWEIPEDLFGVAQLRFLINNDIKVSETFAISSGLFVNTALNCEDTTQIIWNKKPNTINYTIYNLQENEMKEIATVTDTSFVFSKMEYPNPYFSVQPVLLNNIPTLRSTTLNTDFFLDNCYFNSVFPSLNTNNVQLEVSLSSIYDILKIELYRVNEDDSLSVISMIDTVDTYNFTLQDADPIGGVNKYQVKITTNNGDEYFSSETDIFFFTEKQPFLVFPNPTTLEQGITIFSNLQQGKVVLFELYDLNGQRVLQEQLNSDIAFINLTTYSLSAGLYIYKITGDNVSSKVVSKLLIQ